MLPLHYIPPIYMGGHKYLAKYTYSLYIMYYRSYLLVDEVVCALCANGGTCSANRRDLSCSCAAGLLELHVLKVRCIILLLECVNLTGL